MSSSPCLGPHHFQEPLLIFPNRKYRGTKIEYGPDECAQPYDIDRPTKLQAPRREAPPLRKGSNMSNRFQLLNIDGEDSDEENQLPLSLRTKNGVL